MGITALSSVVNMPPGHYAKIAQVLRGLVCTGRRSGRIRRPRKRSRPYQNCDYKNRVRGRAWINDRDLEDPDGMMELWIR